MARNSTEYSELYLCPPYIYKSVLANVSEETQAEIQSLNKRLNPNLDFFSKTMQDNRQDNSEEKKVKKSKKPRHSKSVMGRTTSTQNTSTSASAKDMSHSLTDLSDSSNTLQQSKTDTINNAGEVGAMHSFMENPSSPTQASTPINGSKTGGRKRKKKNKSEVGEGKISNGGELPAKKENKYTRTGREIKKPVVYGKGKDYFPL